MIVETDRTLKPIAEYNMSEGNITFGLRIKLRQRLSQWDVSLSASSEQPDNLAPYAYDSNKFTSSWKSLSKFIDNTYPFNITLNDNTLSSGINQFNYVGVWNYNNSLDAYCNNYHYSTQSGGAAPVNYCQIVFIGSQVKLYTLKTSICGIAAISIDEGAEIDVDLYSPTELYQFLVYTSPILSDTQHTIKIRTTGRKNPASSDYYISVDKIEVYRATEWLKIDTHTSPIVNQIKIYKHNLKTFKIQISDNGTDWQDLQTVTDNARTENVFSFADTSCRYYRFLINSIQDINVSAEITEIVLYRIIEIAKDNFEEDDTTALSIRREKESDTGLISMAEFDLTLDNSQGNYTWINQAIRGANTEIAIEVSYKKWDGIGDPMLDSSWAKEYYPLIQGYLNTFELNANSQTLNIRGRDLADKFNVVEWTSPMYDNMTALEIIQVLCNHYGDLPSEVEYDADRPDIEIQEDAKQLVNTIFLDDLGVGKAGVIWEGFPMQLIGFAGGCDMDLEDNSIWVTSLSTLYKVNQSGLVTFTKNIYLLDPTGNPILPNSIIYDYIGKFLWYIDTVYAAKLSVIDWSYKVYSHSLGGNIPDGRCDGEFLWIARNISNTIYLNKLSPENLQILETISAVSSTSTYFNVFAGLIGITGQNKEWFIFFGSKPGTTNIGKVIEYNKNTQQTTLESAFTQSESGWVTGGLAFFDTLWMIWNNGSDQAKLTFRKCYQLQFNLSQANIQSIDNPPNDNVTNFQRPEVYIDGVLKDITGVVVDGILKTDDFQLNYETGELGFFLPPVHNAKITAKYDYLFTIPFCYFEDQSLFESMQKIAETKGYVISVSPGTFNVSNEDDNEAKLVFKDNVNERNMLLYDYPIANKYQIKDASGFNITYLIPELEKVSAYNPDKDTGVSATYEKGVDYDIDYTTGQVWWLTTSLIKEDEAINIVFYCEPTFEFSYDSNMTSLSMSWGRDQIINKVTVEGEHRFPASAPLDTKAIYAVTPDDKLIDTKFENVKQLQTIKTKDAEIWRGYSEAWIANAKDRDLEIEFDNKFIGIKSIFNGAGGFPDRRIRVKVTPVDVQSETGNQVGVGQWVNWSVYGGDTSDVQVNKEVIESFPSTTKLRANIDSVVTIIPVDSTLRYPPKVGAIIIDSEKMSYTGITSGIGTASFTGVVRGIDGTIATNHDSGAIVTYDPTHSLLNVTSLKVDHRGLQVEVDNLSDQPPATPQSYFLKVEIQAYPICLIEKPLAIHLDYVSKDKYGLRTKQLENKFLTDLLSSKWLARHIVKLNREELPQTSIEVLGSAFLELGDIVKVREINSKSDGYFEVVRLNHTFSKNRFLSDCDLRLVKWINFV